ncbi:4Fe-4S ferredoxin iron-sulfur binding domain-containing protein, partial [mine drainage metagenome]
KLPISERLGVDAYTSDRESHLTLSDPAKCVACALKPCLQVCPAKVYEWQDGRLVIHHENCLELGACRIACHEMGNGALIWEFPRAASASASDTVDAGATAPRPLRCAGAARRIRLSSPRWAISWVRTVGGIRP